MGPTDETILRTMQGGRYVFLEGSKAPNNRVLGPKHNEFCSNSPYYLGPWTLSSDAVRVCLSDSDAPGSPNSS